MKALQKTLLRLSAAGALIAAVATASASPAAAQIVLMVNGEPITAFDIEQRSKFLQLQASKPVTRKDVIDELIDDKLKVQSAKRYGMEVGTAEIDNAYANIARRMRQTPEQLTKTLESKGVHSSTLKSRLKADMTWNQIVRGKFQNSLQIGDRDIRSALERKGNADDFGYDYALRPILFVVPRGAAESVIEARKKEAEALRTRFTSCEDSVAFARSLRDVVVRETIHRNSSDLSPQLRQVLDQIPIGKLTPPEMTTGGIEVFALCGKDRTTSETPGKKEARDELFQARFQEQQKRFLAQLRKQAMIEYKQ
jgi:peptidyl-prolyl cis-trans isomerase SurA